MLKSLKKIRTHHKNLPGEIFLLTNYAIPLTVYNVESVFSTLNPEYSIDIVIGNEESAVITAFKNTSKGLHDVERKKGLDCEKSYIINTWLITEDRYDWWNEEIIIDKNTLKEQGLFLSGYREINFSYDQKKVLWCKSLFQKPENTQMVLDSFQNGLSNRGGTNVSKFNKYTHLEPELENEILFCKSCVHYFSKHNVVKNLILRCPYCEEPSMSAHLPVVWFQPKTLNVIYKDTYYFSDDINHGLDSIVQLKIKE